MLKLGTYASVVQIWTEKDDDAVRVLTRVWRWRIYAVLVIAGAVVIAVLLSRA